MDSPDARPGTSLLLFRFAVRALRIAASTVAVVALLRQQWLAAVLFTAAWLLILGAPRVLPQLTEPAPDAGDPPG